MLLHFVRTSRGRTRERALRVLAAPRAAKRARDVAWLRQAMIDAGSLEYGRAQAAAFSERALEADARLTIFSARGDDRRFLREMLRYVIHRLK
jgi:geranylgeranyl pyrophosphate synthase